MYRYIQADLLDLEESFADAKKDLNDFECDEEIEQGEKMYDDLEEMHTKYYENQMRLLRIILTISISISLVSHKTLAGR